MPALKQSSSVATNNKKQGKLVFDKTGATTNFYTHIAIWLWLSWFFLYTLVILTCLWTNSFLRIPWILLMLIIGISSVVTVKRKFQPKFASQLGAWILQKAADYFQLKVYLSDQEAVEKAGPCIFVLEPHGVLPLGIFALSDVIGVFRNHKGIGCVSSMCFLVPIMRHIFTWCFAETVSKENMTRLLKEGFSVALCPGGVQEVFYLNNQKKQCVLFLKQRLGYVKLALEHGTPLVPTFTFGLQNAFTFYVPEGEWMKWVGRKIGFAPMMYCGIYGLPLGPPKPCQLTIVIGVPILVPKVINPSFDEILKYQDLLLKGMQKLYDTNKDQNDMADVELVII